MISDQAETEETLAFEAALRMLQENGHSHHAAYAAAVPPYLRRLMLGYSLDLAASQTRYDRLVDRLLQLPTHITFVSLNYDVLLDDHLDGLRPLSELGDYLPTPRGVPRVHVGGDPVFPVPPDRGGRWALIKPHGSVAWHQRDERSRDGETMDCVPIGSLTIDHADSATRPALALPVGEKDELTCPEQHLAYLRSQLEQPEIDLLVLGYSGIDTEILSLVRDGGGRIRRLTVVNQNGPTAIQVMQRLHDHGVMGVWPDIAVQGYGSWVDDGGLRRWAADFGQPFEHITDPETARIESIQRLVEPGQDDDGTAGSRRDLEWLRRPNPKLGRLGA